MTNIIVWILSLSLCYELSSSWQIQFSLRDVLKGQCRDVCPRMCRKDQNSLSSDYSCGFVCQNVCSSTIRKRRSKRDTNSVKQMHITPIPSKMKFFDIDNDGAVNLFEFARALGHNPRKLHVVKAFKAADLDDDEKIGFFEFNNDVWVTDQDVSDDNYEFEISDEADDTDFDSDSGEGSTDSDSSRGSGDSGSKGDSDDSGSKLGSASGESDSKDSKDNDSGSADRDTDNGSDKLRKGDNDSGSDDSREGNEEEKRIRSKGRKGTRKNKGKSRDSDSEEKHIIGGIEGDGGMENERDEMGDNGLAVAGGTLVGGNSDGIDMDGMNGIDVRDGIKKVVEGTADVVEDVADGVKDIADGVKDAAEKVVEGVAGVGENIVENVAEGMDGAMGAVGDTVENIADGMEKIDETISKVGSNLALDNVDDSRVALAAIAASGSNSNSPPPITAADSLMQPIFGGSTLNSMVTSDRRTSLNSRVNGALSTMSGSFTSGLTSGVSSVISGRSVPNDATSLTTSRRSDDANFRSLTSSRSNSGSLPNGSVSTMVSGSTGSTSVDSHNNGGTTSRSSTGSDVVTKTVTRNITTHRTGSVDGDVKTPEGNRAARWSRNEQLTSNMLLPKMNLNKGQPSMQMNEDSMTTSFVRTISPDAFGLLRNVAPIRVRVPLFANV